MQLSKPKIKKNYIQVWFPCMTSTLEAERVNSYNPRAHTVLWQLEDTEILTEFHRRPYSNICKLQHHTQLAIKQPALYRYP